MRRPLLDLTRPGMVIAFALTVLLGVGLASIYASRAIHVGGIVVSGRSFAIRQLVFTGVGLIAAIVVLRVSYLRLVHYAYVILALCLVMLLPLTIAKLFHTSFGGLVPESRGAYRWIRLPGFQLQPSEVMKVAYILALAWYLRYRKNYRTFMGMLWPIVFSAVPLLLILMQPDLGTVLLFLPVLFSLLFVAGAKVRHILAVMGVGLVMAPVAFTVLKPYQRARITAVALQSDNLRKAIAADPDKYAFTGVDKREALEWEYSTGMQLVRSKAALGSGGLFGQGWGEGTYVEYNFLPDRHNDFVFAVVGHQWGLVGCLAVLACYGLIVVAGLDIAADTAEPAGRLLAVGVVCLFASQVIINVGMTVGLMPITGMTLPFVSYGGSSLVTNFVAVALLISVSQHRPFNLARKPFEWREMEYGG